MTGLLTPDEVADRLRCSRKTVDEDDERRGVDLDLVGVVYVIQALEKTPVKVGFCTWKHGLGSRLQQLQTGNPYRLQVVAHAPGSIRDERSVHKALTPERLSGEWFDWKPRTIAFVDHLRACQDIAAAIEAAGSAQGAVLPSDWDNWVAPESAIPDIFQLAHRPALLLARQAGTAPPCIEQRRGGAIHRYYRIGDVKRWAVANGVAHALCRRWKQMVKRVEAPKE